MAVQTITSLEELEKIYGQPGLASTAKVAGRITPRYRTLIESSPFCALATAGPEGLDCSPRGDSGQCIHIADDKTLMIPDRRGNNRVDSLRNIVRNSQVALLLLIPGSGNTLRINGAARLRIDTETLEFFSVKGKPPRCVIEIAVSEVYFQCARAVLRAGLWDASKHADPATLPTPGEILQEMTAGGIDGPEYDEEWPTRAAKTMW